MNDSDAYLWIRKNLINVNNGTEQDEAINIALKALASRVPLPPIQQVGKIRYGMGYAYHDWYCPTCGCFLAYEPEGYSKQGESNCKKCQQRISWDAI